MSEDNIRDLQQKLMEVAGRIRELREIQGLSESDMAEKTGVGVEEYRACENGEENLSFAFLYSCAMALGVDVTDFIEGASPRLSSCIVTRSGRGQHVQHAHGMDYYSLAHAFRGRRTEPLYVIAGYDESLQDIPVETTTHEGQECDIVISGILKVRVGEQIEILHPGDSTYYDCATAHGMIATGAEYAEFNASVIDPESAAEPTSWRALT
ncbi:MAG: helix-turn-helix transcriptional regulator, partial [Clostridiales bacterium]|nr:helix-turn-helix transcriptional regulator [Clostridiales bacterium]